MIPYDLLRICHISDERDIHRLTLCTQLTGRWYDRYGFSGANIYAGIQSIDSQQDRCHLSHHQSDQDHVIATSADCVFINTSHPCDLAKDL